MVDNKTCTPSLLNYGWVHGLSFRFIFPMINWNSCEYSRLGCWVSGNLPIIMIDLNANRGNGFQHIFASDLSVKIFNIYNFQVYPGLHPGDPNDYPYLIPLKAKVDTSRYLTTLTSELPEFLKEKTEPKLAFYNAGTDILESDPLGGLSVDYAPVLERDRFVMEEVTKRIIPTVIMTTGGYTKQSFELVAELAKQM
jgi:histone deacetylase 11